MNLSHPSPLVPPKKIVNLTDEQSNVIHLFNTWRAKADYSQTNDNSILTLSGAAGTGKTTIIQHIIEDELKGLAEEKKLASITSSTINQSKIAVIAFTNKAVKVLKKKGIPNAMTIHNLMYNHTISNSGDSVFVKKSEEEIKKEYSLIIVDESTMVTPTIHQDLCSTKLPIFYIGDIFQLPGILSSDDNKKYPNGFCILDKPNIELNTIHRQDSKSLIYFAANKIRNGGQLNYFNVSEYKNYRYLKSPSTKKELEDIMLSVDITLCGTNPTVKKLNLFGRQINGKDNTKYPYENEKLISWSNNYNLKIYNSDELLCLNDYSHIKLTESIDWKNLPHIRVKLDDEKGTEVSIVPIFKHFLTDKSLQEYEVLKKLYSLKLRKMYFAAKKYSVANKKILADIGISDISSIPMEKIVEVSFSHSLTCHKAQGGEFNNVLVINESKYFRQYSNNWLYTAITRSKENLTIFDYLLPYGTNLINNMKT